MLQAARGTVAPEERPGPIGGNPLSICPGPELAIADRICREIAAQEELMGKGLTQMTRLLTPQRELARLQGTAGQVEASLAENRSKVADLEIELVRLTSKVREEAIAELRELEFREMAVRSSGELLC
jgi:hypothetical protein